MAARYDITIEQGSTFVFDLEVTGVDLSSGYTARMQGRTSHAATSTTFSLTNGSGITISYSAGNSHLVPTLTATATTAMTAPSSGVYDLEYEHTASGVVTRILEGTYYVTPEVTRA